MDLAPPDYYEHISIRAGLFPQFWLGNTAGAESTVPQTDGDSYHGRGRGFIYLMLCRISTCKFQLTDFDTYDLANFNR